MWVVIGEDHALVRKCLVLLLERGGFQVVGADSHRRVLATSTTEARERATVH
jgi:DNA-binding NarL/FixJ family response regulator